MPTKEYYLEQIEKELAGARKAVQEGNDGRARVCVRRAVGHAITWFISKNPRTGWGSDSMTQMNALKSDQSFPPPIREAAVRLTARISEQFTYQFSTDPIADGNIIIDFIKSLMESDVS